MYTYVQIIDLGGDSMWHDVTTTDLATALDETSGEILRSAKVFAPPVDTIKMAGQLGFQLAWDDRQAGRARLVRLAETSNRGIRPSIFLRRDPRPERVHWAVAHELGEQWAWRAFQLLGVEPESVESNAGQREQIANALAGRILVPTDWFASVVKAEDWQLPALKRQFATASHELLARRMLDLHRPIVISVFDQGKLTWRRSNLEQRAGALTTGEVKIWQRSHQSGETSHAEGLPRIDCWAIHEAEWKREIMRSEIDAWDE